MTLTDGDFARQLHQSLDALAVPSDVRTQINSFVDRQPPFFWEAANLLGAWMNTPDVSSDQATAIARVITAIREHQGEKARRSTAPATIVFGTSGWRDVIGEGFTLLNVHKVVRGIIDMMHSETFLQTNGYTSYDDVQSHGILVLRDNRYMGDEFIAVALQELSSAGIRAFNAGECPTGVGSALVRELDAAGSINFTPSHNPMDYAGIKFNPRDGGPADPALTSIIEEKANGYMRGDFSPASDPEINVTTLDAKEMFRTFVEQKSRVFDIAMIRRWLAENRDDLHIIIDFMHGASRGYIEHLLGEDLVRTLTDGRSLALVNTNDDYSFHGLKPEPSARNQKPLIDRLKKSGRHYTLAVALDPDADRIRCADANLDVDMNRFGAIAYAHLLSKGIKGGVASTVPSSDFGLEIAKKESMKVFETAVGFKNFRVPLTSGEAVLAFEESDGITVTGHTLEKCAIAGFLCALDSMAVTGKNLSEQYAELQQRYGYFYPDKAGEEIKGMTVDEWQRYRRAVESNLRSMFAAGDKLSLGNDSKRVADVNTIDGTKLIFDDRSWVLLRSSGTEPKFRYYYEVASDTPLDDAAQRLEAYRSAAAAILDRARDAAERQS